MRRPNFFIAGAPRCGTSSLCSYLKQHPEVYVSLPKEPHFFGSDLSPLPGGIREQELYLSLFTPAGDRPRLGEASVYYLGSATAPFEIRAFAPEAKVIVMLRDPVQIARSLFSLYGRTGNEDLTSFEAALDAEPERRQGRRIPSGAYFPEGLLYTDIARCGDKVERFLAVFGRENVHCIVFDDFVRDTPAVYRRTLEFLGVDAGFAADLDLQRARQLDRITAIRQLRQTHPEVRRRLQLEVMKQHDGPAAPPISAALTARLRELFAADVARLGAILGRDLGAWTRGETVPSAAAPISRRRQPEDPLAGVRALKSFPPELRSKHDKVETLERKFARWRRMRVPELSLEQRPYCPAWPDWFAEERARIVAALGARQARIEHFGSTSVPGLAAKNVVDIAVGLQDLGGADSAVAGALAGIGYAGYGNSPLDPETLWFWKLGGDRAFVLHVCDQRRPWIGEQVDMREYLRAHAEERDRYAEMKRRLAEDQGKGLLDYSLRKLAITVDLVDRAQAWQAAAAAGSAATAAALLRMDS